MADIRIVRGRDVSPNSVISTFESNFRSLFSSTSASVDRCSFASDSQDHDSLSSDVSPKSVGFGFGQVESSSLTISVQYLQHRDSLSSDVSPHLAGCGGRHESSSGPDLDRPMHSNSSFLGRKVEKAKVNREEDKKVLLHLDDEIQALDSARSSFSLALKECQERRSRSETLTKKLERRRPASLDLNNSTVNVVSSSPRLEPMKKTSLLSRKSGNFPSPGAPNYRHGSVGVNKGWSSERVPLSTNANRRHGGTALFPLNNGRTLPSKWEDAERWILSPVAADGGGGRTSTYQQPLRRPKSKSGPLGQPGIAYYSMYSPAAVPVYEGSNSSSHMAASPFSAGVMVADGLSFCVGNGLGRAFPNCMEPCIARSASVHGCTDLVCQTSLTSSQGTSSYDSDESTNDVKDSASNVCRTISRRDMATQMSPTDSCHSTPRSSSFSPSTPSILPIVEVQSFGSSKSEVRDVQVDERVTVTRWSKKYRGRNSGNVSENVDEWKLKAVEPRSSAWEVSETVKSLSKARREEAKIIAWENLQQAKAEAAIRKLEMKLEKKRSSSMDKIMKKLRSAQRKAQEMRRAVLANQAIQVSKTNNNALSFRRTRQMGSLSGCFTCHAF